MDRRHFIASGAAATTLALLPDAVRAQAPAGQADAALNAAFQKAFDESLKHSPELATQLGLDKGANAGLRHKLSEGTQAAKDADLARTRTAIATITAIGPERLSPAARLNREVVLYLLESNAMGQARFKLDSPQYLFVIAQNAGAYFSIPDFLDTAHTIAGAEDAEAYLDRTRAFGRALDQDTEQQRMLAARGVVVPDFALDLALSQMATLRKPAGAENTLTRSIARRTAGKVAGDWAARCAAIVEKDVYPALDRQIAMVKGLRAKARSSSGIWDIPRGDEIYAAALEQATTTRYTPDEVHTLGLAQVAELSAQLDTILNAQGLTTGSVGARLTALNADPAQLYPDTAEGRRELIASLNAGNAAMQAKLTRAFNNPPNAPLDIRAVPVDIQDGASNGYYHPAPLDGARPAIYWINLKSVGDWPKYSLPSLTYHEGVPGHHLQLTIARGADQPMLRKISFLSAYGEGWGLYAEQVADELGGYADPIEKAGYLQSFLFRAARLVIDTGIHHKRWTREQATDYLASTTGFARPRALREIERYCTRPGQACSYKMGHIAWLRARERAQKALGDKFDLRAFHDVLHEGAVPLTILDRLIDERTQAALKG